MTLDVPTLTIVSTCIAALLGLFLFFVWRRERSIRALAWWGGAYLLGGAGVALSMVDSVAAMPIVSGLPHAILFLACAMIWNGARLFQGRTTRPVALFAGALVWLAASQNADFAASIAPRVILSSLIVTAYTVCSARELLLERRRQSDARWVAVLVPVLHGMVFLSPIPLMFLDPGERMSPLTSGGWGAIFILLILLYAVGTAFIVMHMVKDRETRVHRTAANTDPLTGVLNRRGFFSEVACLLSRSKRGEQMSVLMCDIDHFKSINDRFGHDAGDETLQTFAAILLGSLRATDVIGRLGGEEFAIFLPGAIDAAATAGERVRSALEARGAGITGRSVDVTVSIGVATAQAANLDIRALIVRADAALYRAKTGGRNRIVLDAANAAARPNQEPASAAVPMQTFSPVTTST